MEKSQIQEPKFKEETQEEYTLIAKSQNLEQDPPSLSSESDQQKVVNTSKNLMKEQKQEVEEKEILLISKIIFNLIPIFIYVLFKKGNILPNGNWREYYDLGMVLYLANLGRKGIKCILLRYPLAKKADQIINSVVLQCKNTIIGMKNCCTKRKDSEKVDNKRNTMRLFLICNIVLLLCTIMLAGYITQYRQNQDMVQFIPDRQYQQCLRENNRYRQKHYEQELKLNEYAVALNNNSKMLNRNRVQQNTEMTKLEKELLVQNEEISKLKDFIKKQKITINQQNLFNDELNLKLKTLKNDYQIQHEKLVQFTKQKLYKKQ